MEADFSEEFALADFGDGFVLRGFVSFAFLRLVPFAVCVDDEASDADAILFAALFDVSLLRAGLLSSAKTEKKQWFRDVSPCAEKVESTVNASAQLLPWQRRLCFQLR